MKTKMITTSGYSYHCDILNRTFTFNSEDKYRIHLKLHRKKCKNCDTVRFIETGMHLINKSHNIANSNEVAKALRHN